MLYVKNVIQIIPQKMVIISVALKGIFVRIVNLCLFGNIKKNPEPKSKNKNLALKCYLEGLGINSICRIFKISKNSILSIIKNRGKSLENRENINEYTVSCDEFYTFVQNKKTNRRWIWVAYSKQNRKVIHYYIGDRSSNSAKTFINGFPEMEMYFTDDWKSYNDAIPENKRFIGKKYTQDIERLNLSVRSGPSRFIRKTIKFSKTDSMLSATLNLFFNYYNSNIDKKLFLS